ncbi:uncharacterized protein LOC133405366 [Phycodurus eques]|uniref:uncharacterized protein LOC133405366 n=1 Tax=Phycodurus eques TaxID=693459 RepID=UPI002ACD917D|nr:uncharacterized protein LOC133405366 [Phycodurus eques]
MAGSNGSLVVGSEERSDFSTTAFIQVLIAVFLSVNLFQLGTFFAKDRFLSSMRYVLFANMLLNDCWFLIVSDVLLFLYQFRVTTHVWLCLPVYFVMAISVMATPCTLTAMTVERYVAVCMPLRHAELCATQRALSALAVIGGLSCIPCLVFYLAVFASVADGYYERRSMCSVNNLEAYPWQNYLRSAMYTMYFLAMGGVIVFCYVRITWAARAVSASDREASRKGLSTVTLHAFQLVLCFVHLLLPPVEKALMQLDYTLFRKFRLFNYIALILAPRCLSPLVYGLRDEVFFKALKYYALCGLSRKNRNGGKGQISSASSKEAAYSAILWISSTLVSASFLSAAPAALRARSACDRASRTLAVNVADACSDPKEAQAGGLDNFLFAVFLVLNRTLAELLLRTFHNGRAASGIYLLSEFVLDLRSAARPPAVTQSLRKGKRPATPRPPSRPNTASNETRTPPERGAPTRVDVFAQTTAEVELDDRASSTRPSSWPPSRLPAARPPGAPTARAPEPELRQTLGPVAFFDFFCFVLRPGVLCPLVYGFRDWSLRGHVVEALGARVGSKVRV